METKTEVQRRFLFHFGNITVWFSVRPDGGSYYWWNQMSDLKIYGPFETLDKTTLHYEFMYGVKRMETVLDKQAKGIITEMPADNAIHVDFLTKKRI